MIHEDKEHNDGMMPVNLEALSNDQQVVSRIQTYLDPEGLVEREI
jgi:hypothetical protein